jgi:nucleoid-associated protein YgaU
MGSVERVLVLGIVVVIVAILGIAVWGASDSENGDNTPAQDGGAVVQAPDAPMDTLGGLPPTITPPTETAVDDTMSEIERLQAMREAARNPQGLAVNTPQGPGGPTLSDGGSGSTPGALPADPAGGIALKSNVPVTQPAPLNAESPLGPTPVPVNEKEATTYVVVAGDSLSKIAHKQYGSGNVQKQMDAILAANPGLTLKSVLKIGQKLTLPAAVPVDPARLPAELQAAATGDALYTVKAGDTLSTIAKRELGSSKRWKEIYELNRTRLPDPAKIVVGMKLTLPKKN